MRRPRFFRIERTVTPDGGPACQYYRFLSTSLTLLASCRQEFCVSISAFLVPILPDASSTCQPFRTKPRSLLDSWCPPAPGRRPDAFPRGPLSRNTLPAASPRALCATHTTRAPPCPACRHTHFLTAFHPREWSGECSRGLGCAGPGDPATDPHSGIRDSLPSHGRSRRRPAPPSALAAPSHQCRRRRIFESYA